MGIERYVTKEQLEHLKIELQETYELNESDAGALMPEMLLASQLLLLERLIIMSAHSHKRKHPSN